MVARFFVDENDLALGKALAALHGDVVYPGHPELPEVPRQTEDDVWLEVVGRRRLVVITRDKKIRYRPVEKQAWVNAPSPGIRADRTRQPSNRRQPRDPPDALGLDRRHLLRALKAPGCPPSPVERYDPYLSRDRTFRSLDLSPRQPRGIERIQALRSAVEGGFLPCAAGAFCAQVAAIPPVGWLLVVTEQRAHLPAGASAGASPEG
jgi:hypothetical protein